MGRRGTLEGIQKLVRCRCHESLGNEIIETTTPLDAIVVTLRFGLFPLTTTRGAGRREGTRGWSSGDDERNRRADQVTTVMPGHWMDCGAEELVESMGGGTAATATTALVGLAEKNYKMYL
ncbi:hypothetical protein HAX54_035851 [Datura stramonium]|uniref:Uncharacterized protein n=1 Tax=Datura stramonium TaxID=4076 RepID=A0ABS8VI67_DATST|nr:hypothetical protein [Datura stramonium]